MNTLVIGLGNPILSDDGVGIYAARAVRRLLPPDADADVVELAVGGLELMEAMIGYERAIIIDALWQPDLDAGQVVQFTAGDLPETMNSANAHNADLPTALRAGRELGAALPASDQIEIVAVTARQVLAFADAPTPPVLAAIPEAVAVVLGLLGHPAEADPALAEALDQLQPLVGGYDDFT
ncbi:MAG: hydrogenase maturation protease [Anaerolineae bacterium]|nr:hydrogenase maturation protease [Anaerolineae bacterium]